LILITTSHKPSPRTRSFIKDLSSILPGSHRTNRGHKTLLELAIEARRRGLSYVAIVTDHGGNPGAINIYEVVEEASTYPKLVKIITLVIGGVRLSRESPEAARVYGISKVGVDSSRCVSDDCFYISDVLIKIFNKLLSGKPDVTIVLEENKYITLKCVNVHGGLVGPVIRVLRAVRDGS